MDGKRPPVRIRFKYNVDTGEIEEFIVDDNAASAPDSYHDAVARQVAGCLSRDVRLRDAGPGRLSEAEPAQAAGESPKTEDRDVLSDGSD